MIATKNILMSNALSVSNNDLETLKEELCYDYQRDHSLSHLQDIASPLHSIVVACDIISLILDHAVKSKCWQQILQNHTVKELFGIVRNPVLISCYDSRYINPDWENLILENIANCIAKTNYSSQK